MTDSIIPFINFGLLCLLAVVSVASAVIVNIRKGQQRWLISFLAVDFTYVAVFIWFYSVNPAARPEGSWWLDLQWGRMAYWPIYTSLIVAFLGYIKTLIDPEVDEETRRIVEQNQ